MGKINWSELFSTKWSVVVFVSYMVLCINQGLLVTASQSSTSTYNYNTVTAVLIAEVIKLIVSSGLFFKDNPVFSLVGEIRKNARVMVLYFFPAFMYCLYNNLAFVNLSAFDPTTYYLLLQFRVVVTGIVFQILFRRQLSQKQWFSLILLTLGCMIKQIDFSHYSYHQSRIVNETTTNASSKFHFTWNINIFLIFIQTLCSCVAGVYNESLLKGAGADVNIFVQNIFMYVDSVICNAVLLFLRGDLTAAFSKEALSSVFTFKVLIVMINNAAIGITTSFFLKNLNSILKTFASALELMFTAVLCWIFFSIPIHLNTIVAISIVSYAVYLYSLNPVVNPPRESKETVDQMPLMTDNAEEV